jgi:divalent metal cation (Fe/Co/Zn/Cd) transporter
MEIETTRRNSNTFIAWFSNIAIASMIIVPILTTKKYTIVKEIESNALPADSRETVVCASLSLALHLGLASYYLIGFWQADPIVGLIIVLSLLREGWEGWHAH